VTQALDTSKPSVIIPGPPPALLRNRIVQDAREVLILTYNCDFSFFEDTCLAEARAVRACVTVLHDAFASPTLSSEMPAAGTQYLGAPVRVRGGGAFHPKLLVVAGDDEALVAIGSGNATGSGWHHNAEIWTVLHANAAKAPVDQHSEGGPQTASENIRYPTTYAQLADWLDELPDVLIIDPFAAERVRATAALLRRHPATAHGPALVHNLARPLLAALPSLEHREPGGTQVAIASPFLDKEASALAATIRQLQPSELIIALTKGAVFDPGALTRVLDSAKAAGVTSTVAAIDSDRYHHGKLIQVIDGKSHGCTALVGSANVTVAALLKRATDAGGNVELGLLMHPQQSLAPEVTTALSNEQLATLARETSSDELTGAAGWIAGATLDAGALTITVAAATRERLAAATAHAAALPPMHLTLSEDQQGEIATLTATAPGLIGGEEVRLSLADGTTLGPVRVHDVHAVVTRAVEASPLDHSSIRRIVRDPRLAEHLQRALERLAAVRPPTRGAGHSGATQPLDASARWLARFRAAASAQVGDALLNFALATDTRPKDATVGTTVAIPGGQDPDADGSHNLDAMLADIMATEADLDPEVEDAQVAELGDAAATEAEEPALSPSARTALARRFSHLVKDAESWPCIPQLALVRAVFAAISAGVWHGTAWAPVLTEALESLCQSQTGNTDPSLERISMQASTQAAAACGLALLATAVDDFTVASEPRKLFLQARHTLRAAPVLLNVEVFTDPELRRCIREYTTDLPPGDPRLTTAGIIDAAEHLLLADPLGMLIESLSARWGPVGREGRLLRLCQLVPNAHAAVASVLDRAAEHAPIAATATSSSESVLGMYAPPHVIVVTTRPRGNQGAAYRATFGIAGLATGNLPQTDRWQGRIPERIRRLLADADLDDLTD
jgi:hypothetical protein